MISLRSKVTQAILRHFFLNRGASVYVNELARALGLDPKNVHRKLVELEKVGLLVSRFSGKQRYFTLREEFPLLAEYEGIVRKSYGVDVELGRLLRGVRGIKEAYVFGSYARGTMDELSDIDLLLIGNPRRERVLEVLQNLEKSLGRRINLTEYSETEFATKRKKDPFLKKVFSAPLLKVVLVNGQEVL